MLKTGSRAQDALREGFMVTCVSGLEKLFGIDEMTIEACADYKDRHLNDVREYNPDNMVATLENDFAYFMGDTGYRGITINIIKQLQRFYKKPRSFVVDSIKVGEPRLDLDYGDWRTNIKLSIRAGKWKGYYRDSKKVFEEETLIKTTTVTTKARKASLSFTSYDTFSEDYIPDEAVEAAARAVEIGMKNLKVVRPVVESSREKDPIIVGYIGDTMYMIAWYGYNPDDRFSCNV
jgi:hypothetical protein